MSDSLSCENRFGSRSNSIEERVDDISIEWIREHPDLKSICAPIRFDKFSDALMERNLDVEFKIMVRITETNKHTEKILEFKPQNVKMNRYKTVLPCKTLLNQISSTWFP